MSEDTYRAHGMGVTMRDPAMTLEEENRRLHQLVQDLRGADNRRARIAEEEARRTHRAFAFAVIVAAFGWLVAIGLAVTIATGGACG